MITLRGKWLAASEMRVWRDVMVLLRVLKERL
jgi:hypothetical protein